ncbi:MAG: hypothetical protein GY851_04725 [bacterium]|nr:hypothetical protein [bacterium]
MQTVRVRLRKPTRVFTFRCDNITLKREDSCIVRSDRGLEYGVCIMPPETCSDDLKDRVKMSVVRKATESDEHTFDVIQSEEAKAREICKSKISEHKLGMKLVDVEYTFDKHKIVFYFTAAERVDFRHLVRDLAQDLKTRIELRHIQVRDEAKIVGGLGVCGRELCCATWLPEFKPISMKMAKRQNLSLNPSKISGQCGRLLCCLEYENENYEDVRKRKRTEAAEQARKQAAEADRTGGREADAAQPAREPQGTPRQDAHPQRTEAPAPRDAETAGPTQAPADSATPAGSQTQGGSGDDQQPKRPRRRRGRRRGRRRSDQGAPGSSGSQGSSGSSGSSGTAGPSGGGSQ